MKNQSVVSAYRFRHGLEPGQTVVTDDHGSAHYLTIDKS